MENFVTDEKRAVRPVFTKDNKLLGQYFILRNFLYHKGLGFSVSVDEFDAKSEHLILIKETTVIGGARLVPREPGSLPMEGNGFNLQHYIDIDKLNGVKIGEISRISIDEENRGFALLETVFKFIYLKCEDLGINCILTIAPRHIARMTAIMCHKLKYSVELKRHIPISDTSLYKDLGEMNLVIIRKNADR